MSHAQAATDTRTCQQCGDTPQAALAPSQPRRCCVSPLLVSRRLEMAGETLLAMRTKHPGPAAHGSSMPDIVRDFRESYGWSNEPVRAAIPSSADITRMEATYAWLQFIPQNRHVLRRIVSARSLIHPVTGRQVITWTRLARLIGCDPRAIRRWHEQGIGIIVEGLR